MSSERSKASTEIIEYYHKNSENKLCRGILRFFLWVRPSGSLNPVQMRRFSLITILLILLDLLRETTLQR